MAFMYFEPSDIMLNFERELWNSGLTVIAGVDEAGRGPLAGPVVAAAVAAKNPDAKIPRVFDSKQLTKTKREELFEIIISEKDLIVAWEEVNAEEIDSINILKATHKAMRAALAKIANLQFAMIDGLPVKDLPCPSKAIVKGDSRSALIAAASIVAKVIRDRKMNEFAQIYPQYGFDKHKGYGTAAHIEAIRKFGPCPIHRKTFQPIPDILSELPLF